MQQASGNAGNILNNEIEHTTRDTKEYQQKVKEMKALRNILDEHAKDIAGLHTAGKK